MDKINEILSLFKCQVDSSSVKEPPTQAEIIDKLCTLDVENPGLDNTRKIEVVSNYVLKSIAKYENYFKERNREVNLKYLQANNGGYRIIKIHFVEDNIPGVLESICIYIPIISDLIEKVVPLVYRHLLSNRISFSSKLSFYNRSDNLIVTVYNKEDAKSLINFCNDNISTSLGKLNPFIAKLGSVGVSKEIYGTNYNRGIASLINEYIEECILNQRKKAYDAIDFQNFVNEQYKLADNYKDKNINYIVSASLYAILTRDNILKFFNDEVTLKFDYDNYYRYEAINLTGEYEYLYCGKVVNKDNDYMCFVKLQALNCLNKIYLEKTEEPIKRNTTINQKFTFKILEQLDNILNKNGNYNLSINYRDIEIQNLIPYLYAYMAYKYKNCNQDEVKKLIEIIKKISIVKKNEEKNKIIYEQDKNKIISSVPLINILNGSVAIDMIDKSTGMSNITIIKKGNRKNYLNVYIKVNYDLLKNNIEFDAKRYRYAIASLLLDEKRNNLALENRKNDFSALFLDAEKETKSYLKIENML